MDLLAFHHGKEREGRSSLRIPWLLVVAWEADGATVPVNDPMPMLRKASVIKLNHTSNISHIITRTHVHAHTHTYTGIHAYKSRKRGMC